MSETGEVNLNLNFKLGERTEVFRSCSVNFKGEMLIFGGDRQRQQVREFGDHLLVEIGMSHQISFSIGLWYTI